MVNNFPVSALQLEPEVGNSDTMQVELKKGQDPQMDSCKAAAPAVSFSLNLPQPSAEQRLYLIDMLTKLQSFDRHVVVGGMKATRRLP